jgi:hypothetical protein
LKAAVVVACVCVVALFDPGLCKSIAADSSLATLDAAVVVAWVSIVAGLNAGLYKSIAALIFFSGV